MPQIGSRVTEETKVQIQELADTLDRSFSQTVEILLKEALAARRVKEFKK